MAPKKNLKCGVGAQCWVYLKYMHPQKDIRQFYKNWSSHDKMKDLLVIGREVKTIKGKAKMCHLFRHNKFKNITLYCAKQYGNHVVKEGDAAGFFDKVPDLPLDNNPQEMEVEVEHGDNNEIPQGIFNLTGSNSEDISHVCNLGFSVDDDNDPAPENIPDNEPLEDNNQSWGWNGIDYRAIKNVVNVKRTLDHGLPELLSDPDPITLASLFMTLFPTDFLFKDVLDATNKNMREEDKQDVTKGELLRFIGLWLFMSTTSGFPRRDYFSTREVNVYSGAPYRIHMWMKRERFEDILRALKYSLAPPPRFKDRFWEVRDIIAAWNQNMNKVFKCGWITCLDESMSVWLNKYTCPGWMFVPRKPKPFDNEYHSICCGLSGVMFGIQLVEGKDHPKELPSPPKKEKTAQLLLDLCESLTGTGKIVVLDSGFCVLKALVALVKIGVFAHAVIKKRRYWPKYVPGDEIEARMKDKAVGEVDSLKGTLDGEPYNLFVMKEPDYCMKLMSTYGTLTAENGAKKATRFDGETRHTFSYTKCFSYHFQYRHMVDDHNNLRHSSPSIKETWRTHRWENRVFAFLLAITEVNIYVWLRYKVWRHKDVENHDTLHQFRKKLALALINNKYVLSDEAEGRLLRSSSPKEHLLQTCPLHAKNSSPENGSARLSTNTSNINADDLDAKKKSGHFVHAPQEFGCARTAFHITFLMS